MNLSMLCGRDYPAKPMASSRRNDCRMASIEKEKIERNDFEMKNVIRPIRTQTTNGCVTLSEK